MGNRLSKIYTRTGDDGTSALADGSRLPKDSTVFVAMGDIDELNSHVGMVLCLLKQTPPAHFDTQKTQHELTIIQHLLFNLGGELAMPKYQGITQAHIDWLEFSIDQMNQILPPLKDFILPTGSQLVCQIHIARSVARRAERSCVALQPSISQQALKLINRLSDYLFVLSRFATPNQQISETLWNSQILSTFE